MEASRVGQVADGQQPQAQPADPTLADNLSTVVRASARRFPGKPALIQGPRSLTWAELDRQVDRAAAGLRGLGLAPGDRIGIALGNDLNFPVAYFGVLRAGLVALPMNPGGTAAEFDYLLADSGARVVIAGVPAAGAAATAAAGRDEPPVVLLAGAADAADGSGASGGGASGARAPIGIAGSFDDLLRSAPAEPVEPLGGGEDLAVLLYTSGTSGRAKAAMLSHRALLADLEHISRIEPPVTRADDVVLLVLPLFHVFGLNNGLGMVARAGATGVLVERFDAAATAELIGRHAVTNLVGAPPMYVGWSLLADPEVAFASVRLAVSGAAPLPPEVSQRFERVTGRRVHEGYGLTETAPSVTSTLCSAAAKPGSIGRPVPGVELQLIDRSGREVDEDDPGEIRVRGANLFSGYWPDGRDGPDEDGWWCTGDVAVADANGDLTLVGRRPELILVSGFNVYPREVEAVLSAHPDVAEVAVVGVPHPYTGESVKAVVVPVAGSSPSADDLLVHAARMLARFKCPTVVEFVPSLPHTATGKIAKGRLVEQPKASR